MQAFNNAGLIGQEQRRAGILFAETMYRHECPDVGEDPFAAPRRMRQVRLDNRAYRHVESLDLTHLRARFERLGRQRGLDQALFERLDRHYGEPSRHYHNWHHIAACLREFDAIAHRLQDPTAVEMAIWFHDAVYVPGSKRNEIESARLAFEAIHPTDAALAEKVQQFIEETDYSRPARVVDADLDFLKDIDFAAFGKPFEEFWLDVERLREESGENAWSLSSAAQRIRFYQSVLDGRVELFRTESFKARLLDAALSNVRQGIARLEEAIRVL